jgi:hypothetical protein
VDDLTYELRQLCLKNRDGSHATQANRLRMLTSIARQLKESGLSNMHGLRHRYAQMRYETLTGWRPPLAGGPSRALLTQAQRLIDAEARQIISQELGHERIEITAVYCGR